MTQKGLIFPVLGKVGQEKAEPHGCVLRRHREGSGLAAGVGQ